MINPIDNSTYFNGNAIVHHQRLTFEGPKISGISSVADGTKQDSLVVPGFIDLQIYGAGGKLFSAEPTVEALSHIENALLKTGTTGFLACIATNTPAVFEQCITVAKAHRSIAKNCLGLHLEGPFINAKRRGAHVLEYIRKATLDEVKALLDFGDGIIKMITIAPELQDDSVIQYLLDNGVVVSLGHSDASFDEATRAYDQGVQTTTHLFNAMSPVHHREPGIPTALFNHAQAMASIIADNQHVSFEVVKMAHKLLKERLFLITDAVTACATGPYQHQALGDKFVMPDGTLSGSSLTMLQAVKNCVNDCDIELVDALKMASQYPAKLIGLEASIGKIAPGADADLLVLDESLDLKEVIFKGERV
ncbi:N-acetylglucosamine-6-phosphate deacetylase [Pedobacter sp. KR3-3]|uniref:N-acetylglucosamine-6-phosphate deacetylase n=1 Tax=Pedobacter albus TaxID=3113905 RepID=A0ABU7IA11_9SPHI|nr:N-acetylglucosamine-6-phosphate deacetylase [Pedobacter sp. KR3-3]MEE1946298.1 N-acetylglucosamine-6-phosphate deacetylase [Pedobacter sp. KR3-3]